MKDLSDFSDSEIRGVYWNRFLNVDDDNNEDGYYGKPLGDYGDHEISDEFYGRGLEADDSFEDGSTFKELADNIRNDLNQGKCVKESFVSLIERITGKGVFLR